MHNSEIKYQTSTDYEALYHLLKSETIVIGFKSLMYQGKYSEEYSTLVQMSYSPKSDTFDIGLPFPGEPFPLEIFKQVCVKWNIRYIPTEPLYPKDFVVWYSRMEPEKIERAYQRWLIEK